MAELILGVDPGKLGALAAITMAGELVWTLDMPVADNEVSPVLIATELRTLLRHTTLPYLQGPHTLVAAVVEEVAAFPKNGSIGNFKLGQAHGKVLGVLGAFGVPVVRPRPTTWKKAMKLSSDKELSRSTALDKWPAMADHFRLKKHADRAEAALLAEWGRLLGGAGQ